MKKGVANYGADFAVGVALFFILMLFLFSVASCVRGNKEDSVKAPISSLKSQEELLVLLKTPVDYNSEKISFSELIRRYYYVDEAGNDNEKEKMKEFIENFLKQYVQISKGSFDSNRRLCWNFFAIKEGSSRMINLEGNCDWSYAVDHYKECLKGLPEAAIPLDPYSKHQVIKVVYRNPGIDTSVKESKNIL